MVKTQKNSIGILAPNALIDKNQRMIPYRNTTGKFVTLTKGQKIGTGIGISDVIDLDDSETVKVNQIKQSSRESKNKDERNKTEIPSQLQSLFDKSTKYLNEEQQIKVISLLKQFENVFAKDDFDLGLFSENIKHKIDTGNSKPIKQKLRRTPLGFEAE